MQALEKKGSAAPVGPQQAKGSGISHATRMGPTPTLTQILSVAPVSWRLSRVPRLSLSKGRLARGLGARQTEVSHVTQIRRLLERLQRIPRRHKFMRDIPPKPRISDGAHHPVPLDFLRPIEFMPPGYTAGVEVSNPLQVRTDRSDQIAFHDL